MAFGQSKFTRSRIAVAIGTGILLGCVFGFLFPQEFITNSNPPVPTRILENSGSGLIYSLHSSSSCALEDRVVLSKADFLKLKGSANKHTNSTLETLQRGKNRGFGDKSLERKLESLANNEKEIIVSLADSSLIDILEISYNSIKRIGITNYIVVALDDDIEEFCTSNNVPFYRVDTDSDGSRNWSEQKRKLNRASIARASSTIAEDLPLDMHVDNSDEERVPDPPLNVHVDNSDNLDEETVRDSHSPVKVHVDDSDDETLPDNINNRVSTELKIKILKEFLGLGYNVLFSDVDIVYFQNPFDYLYRDSDLELMSNGDNNMSTYGFIDAQKNIMSIGTYDSGFFYIKSKTPSFKLLTRVANRALKSNDSFEVCFNKELFLPSYPGYVGLHVSKRIMDFYSFMNSKALLKIMRADSMVMTYKPVLVHVCHHERKLEIMNGLVEFYVDAKKDSLDQFF